MQKALHTVDNMLTVDIKLMITYIALIYTVNCMDTLLRTFSSWHYYAYIMLQNCYENFKVCMNVLSCTCLIAFIYLCILNNKIMLNALLKYIKILIVYTHCILILECFYQKCPSDIINFILTICLLFCCRNWTCCSSIYNSIKT